MKKYEYDYKSLRIDTAVWKELKQMALDREITMKEVVKRLVEGKMNTSGYKIKDKYSLGGRNGFSNKSSRWTNL